MQKSCNSCKHTGFKTSIDLVEFSIESQLKEILDREYDCMTKYEGLLIKLNEKQYMKIIALSLFLLSKMN